MPIEHTCPHCNQSLAFADDAADTQISCPACGQGASLPAAATAANDLARAQLELPAVTSPAVLDFGNPFQSPHAAGSSEVHHRAGRRRHGERDFQTADRSDRFLGAIVDVLCVFGLLLVGWFLSYALQETMGPWSQLWTLLPWPFVFYNWYLIARDGESVGKKAAGTRIVNDDREQLPGFVRGVILRAWIPGLICAIPIVGTIYVIVDIVWIFGSEKRCLHDLIAGTRVVDVSSRRRSLKKVELDFDPGALNVASEASPLAEPLA